MFNIACSVFFEVVDWMEINAIELDDKEYETIAEINAQLF